jgi:hypothetical protein
MALSAAMDTALQGLTVVAFCAVKIVLPGGTVRLIDSAGSVTFGSETYLGRDATYGTLAGIEQLGEEIATAAPRARVTLMPPSNAAITALSAPTAQGSAVTISLGLINEATGAVIGTPETLFVGEIDSAKLLSGTGTRTIELDVASVWERFFSDSEGARLNSHFHKSVYSGELGFDFVVDAADDPYWGSDGPKASATATGGAGTDMFNYDRLQLK